MFGIIFAFFAVVAVFVEEYVLGVYLDFSITNLAFFLIPIGTYVLGSFIGWAMGKGLNMSRARSSIAWILIVIILGAGTYIGVKYMEYKTTYINDEAEDYISREDGLPISELLSFTDYTKMLLDNSSTTVSTRSNFKGFDIDTSGTINYILFFLEWLLLPVGAVIAMKSQFKPNNHREYEANGDYNYDFNNMNRNNYDPNNYSNYDSNSNNNQF